ncbi:5'-methylthioadenosine/S-adenosylhomocysteine nucleosidase family protein [Actinacidiphila bryophytorum]|uniref:5'-methylthioadenosine/S-adenosylhomocysteine nucleosidase family protein n=1 Tax=Actinacidiphila bryophytorum TaxID=1436133 RepID=UPI002176A88B|nr:5'-methylthioadenosine/S-adenosylhomocysteine nucleosidase [Actinacidiphila bryophytorum]UWE07679.1 5'-methylthioadenosine/S-adenosylhomocysteine nucleosidase [Actinacidiphila bryophytorum]
MDEASDNIVVLTALPLEYQAVRRLLETPTRVDHAGTIFERGRLLGSRYTIYLATTGTGNDSAASITERSVSFVQPRAVLFTGIAGALKADVSPGDVVVATEVHAYQGGKQDPERFKARPQSWAATYSLQQVAQYVANIGAWKDKLPEGVRGSTAVHFKPIAAGDIVLNVPQGDPARVFLDEHYNGAVAVEMEGAGFASAAHKAQAVPHLMIRGISDRADGTKQDTDATGMQEAAAQHAALFMAEVIAHLMPEADPSAHSSPASTHGSASDLLWQEVGSPVKVLWRRDIVRGSAYSSGPSLLEVHLVPVPTTGRVPAVRMRQLASELVSLGRSKGFFTNLEQVEAHDSAEMAAASVSGPRGRSAGMAITRSGQLSAWEPLPNPGMTYVLDEEHTGERISLLLSLLMSIDVPVAASYAPAAAVENTRMVTVERLSEVNPRSAALRVTDAPIEVQPEEAVAATLVSTCSRELANELTARLIYSFRNPSRRL